MNTSRRTALGVTASGLMAGLMAGLVAGAPRAARAMPMAARAPGQPVPVRGVIELFTSQGCSSCPPADRLAGELARDPSLVVLTLPVDYWDRLGWKDSLARHAFSERQVAYAGERGTRTVYTPQAVVNGVAPTIGSDRDAILEHATMALPVQLTLDADAITATGPRAGSAMLIGLTLLRARDVAIGRGENARARVTYTNVVRDVSVLGTWRGGTARFARPDVTVDADMGFAVLLQEGDVNRPGRILGAALV